MSMYLEFDPHSWYMGFAIRDNSATDRKGGNTWTNIQPKRWSAYTDDGNTYRIIELHAYTLPELRRYIRDYWWNKQPHTPERFIKQLSKYHLRDYIPL